MPDHHAMTRRHAYRPNIFQSFQNEMAQMLDQFRGEGSAHPTEDFFQHGTMLVPAIDVAETDSALEISADIPGVPEHDLDVTVQGDTLVIKGEKSAGREEKDKDYHLVERRHGSFRRHIPLGFVPDDDGVDADFTNGVLKLTIKRPDDASKGVKKIKIGTS